MNVMLLTAGEGTRLRPHTNFLPKPAISFMNVPLYAYSLFFLNDIAITKAVMNTYHLPGKLKSTVRSFKHPYPIYFSDEEKLMGSGGGISQAQAYFQSEGDFILMNGDEVIIPKQTDVLRKAIESHKISKAVATILVMEHPEVGTKFGGVWVDDVLDVVGFGKETIAGATKGYHYIGVTIFSEKILKYIKLGESNILYDGVTSAIKAGEHVQAIPISCKWFETGNEADFKAATYQCMDLLTQKTIETAYLKKILAWRSPNSEFVNMNNRLILADKKLDFDFEFLLGYNVLGEDVSLKTGCRLKNCILGPRVKVQNAAQLENVMIFNDQDVF